MQGISIAALIATLLSVGIIGGVIFSKSKKEDRKLLIVLFLEYSNFFIAFYWLRLPLDSLMNLLLSDHPRLYEFIKNFYATITEELAKLSLILLLLVYKRIKEENYHLFAFTAGLGFGVGEIWFLANMISNTPQLSSLPW
jgi:hypothetical protein